MAGRPPLSVIVAVREELGHIQPVLDALLPQARRTGSEVLVVGPTNEAAPRGVRLVRVDDDDIYRLRLVGVQEARGEVVAIGEDHAVPRPDWCEAVIRAHAERPDAPAVVGCLVNATAGTVSGRVNFIAFAGPFQPPMPSLPATRRPPPVSCLSLKRAALAELDDGWLGALEAEILPRLAAEDRLAPDDRVLVDHYQDHGLVWMFVNGFHSARASYGLARWQQSWRERLRQARWSLVNWPRRIFADGREATGGGPGQRFELALVAAVGVAAGVGAAVGSIAGPGSSPDRVA
jgi:hypothetical protein